MRPTTTTTARRSPCAPAGFYLETYGGGCYTAIGWWISREQAERARRAIVYWQGMPPRIVAG